jgi:hypothetical protein
LKHKRRITKSKHAPWCGICGTHHDGLRCPNIKIVKGRAEVVKKK